MLAQKRKVHRFTIEVEVKEPSSSLKVLRSLRNAICGLSYCGTGWRGIPLETGDLTIKSISRHADTPP